ncbi:MAG: leucine--tRNA ligase [Candidatus Eisenbacteria bacterium]
MKRYDFRAIEKKWQKKWAEEGTFRTLGPGDPRFDASKPKYYVLDMFPYPSGAGLHVGHPLGYIATDIVARYKRMRGHNVLHPMGFDAFGLPAEQYAIEHGVHPRITTEKNIETMRRQLQALGLSYDWDREIATIDVRYYRWTQWIFLRFFDSWYDTDADRARPIPELLGLLESGEALVGPRGDTVRKGAPPAAGDPPPRRWSSLNEEERRVFIDSQRLAYLAEVPVNWCPALGTVLANEEVTPEGRSERGNHPVYKRPLKQWMLRITAYARRLLDDLDLVSWPEPIKMMQRNWIGRSEGAMVRFPVSGAGERIEVFTTRPDTLFGATYMVLAPEHPLVERIPAPDRAAEVFAYREAAARRSDVERQADARSKSGVFTGAFAVNPATSKEIPIWIADYVLMGYGTGAIMAVPAHDERDFAFAKEFGLPIRAVVVPGAAWLNEQGAAREAYLRDPASLEAVFTGEGEGVNSSNEEVSLDGLPTPRAAETIAAWLERRGIGAAKVQYKLRDWLFSRQRYWGEPFPLLHGSGGRIRAVEEGDLPVLLPEMEDFRPVVDEDPETPPKPSLARAPEEWRVVKIGGERWEREHNTMPQWAGSCWYYLRFIDPENAERLVAPDKERYWMRPGGIDLYLGGVEHAVLHLLYARFWHKLLHDLGHLSTKEPFARLFNQGYIQAYAYTDERGVYVDAERVVEREDRSCTFEGKPVARSYGKMGKSLKNAVNPDALVAEYGCDSFRLHEMYMGPIEVSKAWSTHEIVGMHRFLLRVFRNFFDEKTGALLVSEEKPPEEILRLLHKTIRTVGDDLENLRFNTAISALIELNNALVGMKELPRAVAEPLVLMLAPMAPHFCEELWEALGHPDSLARGPWPVCDERYLAAAEVEIVVQVMGKLRGKVLVPADAGEEQVREKAIADPGVRRHLEGKTIRKVIFVPGRLINIVAG